jgi:hypothetical protein
MSSSRTLDGVQVVQESDAKQIVSSIPNLNFLLIGNIERIIWKREADTGRQIKSADNWNNPNLAVWRKRISCHDYKMLYPIISYYGVCGAIIDANNSNGNGFFLTEFLADQENTLNANFWAVSGEEFLSGEPCLVIRRPSGPLRGFRALSQNCDLFTDLIVLDLPVEFRRGGFSFGMFELTFSGSPHFFVGLPQGPGEEADSDGSESGYGNARSVKGFEDLNEEEWRQVIAGAIFLVGLAFLAYLAVKAG